MNIEAKTKLFDVLDEYPDLEDKIMTIAPPFKNLKNPLLRKTVGKLTTIEKIAGIGNLEVTDLVNQLRREAGQPELTGEIETDLQWQEGEPLWIKGEAKQIIDGTEMLSRGEHPLQMMNKLMTELEPNQFLLLKTNFKPIPLIDEMQKQNYTVYSRVLDEESDQHLTFIKK